MRPVERIDNFLSKVDWKKLNVRWNLSEEESFEYTSVPIYLANEWKKVPDQRFGQFMINRGDIHDNFKIWNDEEAEILVSQGLPIEESIYWTSHLDKDGNYLPEKISKLLKDLDTDHIRNIIKYCEENYKSLNMKVCSYFFKRIYNESNS